MSTTQETPHHPAVDMYKAAKRLADSIDEVDCKAQIWLRAVDEYPDIHGKGV